jgi:hypothetical protein
MKKLLLFVFVYSAFSLTVSASETSLCQYIGTFRFAKGDLQKDVEINFKNGQLELESPMGNFILSKNDNDATKPDLDDDEFAIGDLGTIIFTRGTDKKINGIRIKINTPPLELEGEKLEEDDIKVVPLILPRMNQH